MQTQYILLDPLTADQPAAAADTSANTTSTTGDTAAGDPGTAGTTTATGTANTNTAALQQAEGTASLLTMVIPLVLMGVVFYFFLIRPQKKKDKAVKDMLGALKPGDRVCTIGGIYGTVERLKDDTVTISVGTDKSKMVMAKWAIRNVENVTVENDASPEV